MPKHSLRKNAVFAMAAIDQNQNKKQLENGKPQ
jgi:hypothetical protein